MSKSNKFTPGPWEVVTGPHVAESGGDGRSVALIQRMGHERHPTKPHSLQRWDRTDEECERIARLIAAAPEMLEALEHIMLMFEDLEHEGIKLQSTRMRVKSAIAKATGGAE